jgi:cytochrome c biogenesis protein CcmG, thiol:disulfide interchange protein DsbE
VERIVQKVSSKFGTTLVLATLLATGCDRGSHPENINRPAPQFTISDDGHTFDLSKYRGKIVVVNLWATWCAPCIEELPSLLALQRAMPELQVVAISWDEDPAAYRKFLDAHHVDLLTIRDPEQRIGKLYGTVQIPETYIIDKQGNLRRKFVSAQDWTNPEIVSYLKHL